MSCKEVKPAVVPEHLMCALCSSAYDRPMITNCCGSTYCYACLERQFSKDKKCPKCNRKITDLDAAVHENDIMLHLLKQHELSLTLQKKAHKVFVNNRRVLQCKQPKIAKAAKVDDKHTLVPDSSNVNGAEAKLTPIMLPDVCQSNPLVPATVSMTTNLPFSVPMYTNGSIFPTIYPYLSLPTNVVASQPVGPSISAFQQLMHPTCIYPNYTLPYPVMSSSNSAIPPDLVPALFNHGNSDRWTDRQRRLRSNSRERASGRFVQISKRNYERRRSRTPPRHHHSSHHRRTTNDQRHSNERTYSHEHRSSHRRHRRHEREYY